MQAGIYARISLDRDDTQIGVKRQVTDCTNEAKRRGWQVVDTYVDNSISASKDKPRPEYQRMIRDIEAGRIEAFIVWDLDRLTRTPRELEDIIDLAEKRGVKLANIGGDIDLSTPQGMMMARIKGSVARHEADQLARRIRRSVEQRAIDGQPVGQVPYGFQRETFTNEHGAKVKRDIPDPVTGPVVEEAVDRVLSGESLHSICKSYNERGILSPRSKPWHTQMLRQILLRPSIANLSVLRGEIVGKKNGIGVIDEGTFMRVKSILEDPKRRTSKGGPSPRHLLSVIAKCGRCGGNMRRIVGRVQQFKHRKKRMPDGYSCSQCHKVRRKQSLVDEVVTHAVIARLQQPDLLQALTQGRPSEMRKAQDELDEVEARLTVAADQFADGTITGEQLARITDRLRPRVDELKSQISHTSPKEDLALMAGEDAAERWEAAPIDVKRKIIDMLMTVTIMPTGSGRGDKPESIVIEWK